MKVIGAVMISSTLVIGATEAAPKIDHHQKTVVGLVYRLLGTAHICRIALDSNAYNQVKQDALRSQVDAGIDRAQARRNVTNLDKAVRLEVKQIAPKENKAKCSNSLGDTRASLKAAVAKAKAGT